jgi:hypothetical protein
VIFQPDHGIPRAPAHEPIHDQVGVICQIDGGRIVLPEEVKQKLRESALAIHFHLLEYKRNHYLAAETPGPTFYLMNAL